MFTSPDGSVVLSKEEYAQLLKQSRLLWAYQRAGVDNWEGAENVWDILVEKYPEYAVE